MAQNERKLTGQGWDELQLVFKKKDQKNIVRVSFVLISEISNNRTTTYGGVRIENLTPDSFQLTDLGKQQIKRKNLLDDNIRFFIT